MYNISEAMLQTTITLDSASQLVLTLLYYTTICPLMPRFIISMRELYDRDLRGRWQGIDTAFNISSQPGVYSGNAAVSAIQFADAAPGRGEDQEAEGEADDFEGIRLETRMSGDGMGHV